MRTVISKDSAPIGFDRSGEGPPIILVVGAFNDRSTGALRVDVWCSKMD
jgi:hypothetical protein